MVCLSLLDVNFIVFCSLFQSNLISIHKEDKDLRNVRYAMQQKSKVAERYSRSWSILSKSIPFFRFFKLLCLYSTKHSEPWLPDQTWQSCFNWIICSSISFLIIEMFFQTISKIFLRFDLARIHKVVPKDPKIKVLNIFHFQTRTNLGTYASKYQFLSIQYLLNLWKYILPVEILGRPRGPQCRPRGSGLPSPFLRCFDTICFEF